MSDGIVGGKPFIQTLATYVTPAAPALAYGSHIYNAAIQTMPIWAALACGISAAVALECVGIYAGKTTLKAWRYDLRLFLVAGVSLLAYVAIGVWELRGQPFMWLTVIAFFAYVVSGVDDALVLLQADKQAVKEQSNKERDLLQEQRYKVRLAEIEASKQVEISRINAQKDSETFSKLSTPQETLPRHWKKLSTEQKHSFVDMAEGDIANMYNVHIKTAKSWKVKAENIHAKSNGVVKA